MSILSDALSHKITWSEGLAEGEKWFAQEFSSAAPAAQALVTTGLSDFKQALSDAIGLADTALGPILSTATAAIETTANTALTAGLGPIGTQLTPVVDSGITSITNALHAEIDAVAAQVRAKLSPPVQSGGS